MSCRHCCSPYAHTVFICNKCDFKGCFDCINTHLEKEGHGAEGERRQKVRVAAIKATDDAWEKNR